MYSQEIQDLYFNIQQNNNIAWKNLTVDEAQQSPPLADCENDIRVGGIVIAMADGFVDYDSLTVQVKEYEIKSITPNPATNQITVEYNAENASVAFLRITPALMNVGNDYPLNTLNWSTVINVANYLPGVYSVILYCDGVAVDVKQLVIL
jgi:hypothetical protein